MLLLFFPFILSCTYLPTLDVPVLSKYPPSLLRRMTCPARKDEADWLVELTGEAGSPYRSIEAGPPVTAAEFQARWRESDGGKAVHEARHG